MKCWPKDEAGMWKQSGHFLHTRNFCLGNYGNQTSWFRALCPAGFFKFYSRLTQDRSRCPVVFFFSFSFFRNTLHMVASNLRLTFNHTVVIAISYLNQWKSSIVCSLIVIGPSNHVRLDTLKARLLRLPLMTVACYGGLKVPKSKKKLHH